MDDFCGKEDEFGAKASSSRILQTFFFLFCFFWGGGEGGGLKVTLFLLNVFIVA